jgi:hypothetical protein
MVTGLPVLQALHDGLDAIRGLLTAFLGPLEFGPEAAVLRFQPGIFIGEPLTPPCDPLDTLPEPAKLGLDRGLLLGLAVVAVARRLVAHGGLPLILPRRLEEPGWLVDGPRRGNLRTRPICLRPTDKDATITFRDGDLRDGR